MASQGPYDVRFEWGPAGATLGMVRGGAAYGRGLATSFGPNQGSKRQALSLAA